MNILQFVSTTSEVLLQELLIRWNDRLIATNLRLLIIPSLLASNGTADCPGVVGGCLYFGNHCGYFGWSGLRTSHSAYSSVGRGRKCAIVVSSSGSGGGGGGGSTTIHSPATGRNPLLPPRKAVFWSSLISQY
jgi:hypothetical protein